MQILHSFTNPSKLPIALTIGNFDGVHIGHRAILRKLVQVAERQRYQPAAMTFSPHAKVFFRQTDNFLITDDKEKADRIADCGIKTLWQIPFDDNFCHITPNDFIDRLIHQLKINYLLVGDDFRFGYQGQGDFQLLEKACQKYQVELQRTPTICYQNERVSSSRVREAINNNDFDLVEKLLGRRLSYQGKVSPGKQLGRTIDFPTANITLAKTRLLPAGVFAVRVNIEDDTTLYQGMCNIGTKPTVSDKNFRQIETHLFDFNENLYGKTLYIEPIAKIRDEQKFTDISKLVNQLHKDKQKSLTLLNHINAGR